MAWTVKNPLSVRETQVCFLGWEGPLEKGMATHSSILVWRIPWTEEPGRLQSMGSGQSMQSQRIRHDWETFITKEGKQFSLVQKWIILEKEVLLSVASEHVCVDSLHTHTHTNTHTHTHMHTESLTWAELTLSWSCFGFSWQPCDIVGKASMSPFYERGAVQILIRADQSVPALPVMGRVTPELGSPCCPLHQTEWL